MQFTHLFLSTAIAMALAPSAALAWAQAANGVWTANNVVYANVGGYRNVHESCTRMNSNIVLTKGDCAYWTDGKGGLGYGYCKDTGHSVECRSGCPDRFSPCQFAEDDGRCRYGYEACVDKLSSCNGQILNLDCAGNAAGCAAACK